MTGFSDLVAIAHQSWREGAACRDAYRLQPPVEFVDPPPADVEHIVREFCWRCPVVGACREEADRLAPFRHPTVMGARFYLEREPVDGWPAQESA